ncbi:TetR/AcrR family transcriptional regulator, partial [Mycobacterium sp. ITM-2017-0098]
RSPAGLRAYLRLWIGPVMVANTDDVS